MTPPGTRIAQIREELVSREIEMLADTMGLHDSDLERFRKEALEDPRTGFEAIIRFLNETMG